MSVFFLVGDNFISWEDSSPIEYTESGLTNCLINLCGDYVGKRGNSKFLPGVN